MTIEPRLGDDGVPEVALSFTVDELAAVAELAGAASFPGTGEHRLPDDERRAAVRAALVRRGTVTSDGNGGIALEPSQRAMFGCALGAQAVLAVDHHTRAGTDSAVFHATPRLSLAQTANHDGSQRLVAFPTAMLPRRIAAWSALAAGTPGTGEPLVLAVADAHRLLSGDVTATPAELASDVRTASSVRVLRRRGDRLTGGEVGWVDAGGQGLWLLALGTSRAVLAPGTSTDVMGRLRALLD